MYIVDAHCDSIQKVDRCKYGIVNPYNYSTRYRQLQFVAMFCAREGDDVEQCYQRAVRYVGHFCMSMENEKDKVLPVRTYADIERAFSEGKHAALMTMEGGTGIKGSKKILNDFYNIGVRVFGLAWSHNDLAKSNRLAEGEEDTGLTELGREIVEEGNRLGLIFDVSHLSDKSFWDLAEITKKPLMATHSNFRALCSHSRNLTDDMAREIIRQGGMIGLNLWARVVHDVSEQQTIENYFAHLEHCLELGGEDNIGFGGDIDGIGREFPIPLDDSCSVHDRLIDFMLAHNYPETLVEKVAGGNFLAFLKKHL